MSNSKRLLQRNQEWAEQKLAEDPDFFSRLRDGQKPSFLWIGCSDSRVSANQILDLDPGEVFVHRNIANLVVASDLNLLSVCQYAVEILKIEDIVVCGHHGCAGVSAVLNDDSNGDSSGLVDNWISPIRDLRIRVNQKLQKIDSEKERWNKLCELNVVEQVHNLAHTTVIRAAWQRGQKLRVHGWIYGVHDGTIQDLECTVSSHGETEKSYHEAQRRILP